MIRQLPDTLTARKPLRAPFNGFSLKPGAVDFLDASRRLQPLQNAPDLVRLIGSDLAAIAPLEQALQTPVPKSADHAKS